MTARLIGGEMLVWSDFDGKHGPRPAGGPVLGALLGTLTGRILVAGAHGADLLEAVPAGELTVLVRGLPDAEELIARYADRPGVTVLCGSVEKLAAVPAYDVVIALDGLDRLRTAESEDAEVSWAQNLALLAALVQPGGRLLLGLENLFGLHRIVALPALPGDTDWGGAGEHDSTRPASPAALAARLREAGFETIRDYAAYPGPGSPTVLLGEDVLADPELSGFVAATLTGTLLDGPFLADPRRLAVGAVRAGLAAGLAPAWVVLAGKGPADDDRPDGLLSDQQGRVRNVRRAPNGRWIDGDGRALPAGRTLEDSVLAASQRRDLPGLRKLLTAWQRSDAAGVPADQTVVGPDGDFTGLTPAADPATALRRLAGALINAGHVDLWPAPVGEAGLTALLAAMSGRPIEPVTGAAEPGPPAVRELLATRDRLTRELAEARARQDWYESMLAGRETELKRVRKMNALLAATVPGRAAKASVGGLRAGKRALRAVVRKLRP
jgi:hypothetical protein